MHFDPSISLGTIIQIGLFLVVAGGAIRKVGALEQKLDIMYGWFERNIINGHGKESMEPLPARRAKGGD